MREYMNRTEMATTYKSPNYI